MCKAFWKTVIGEELGSPTGPTLGLGQPSASRNRAPRRPATMSA